jgi:Dyp-type peroxidase family
LAAAKVTTGADAEQLLAFGHHDALNVGITAEGLRLAGIDARAHDGLPGTFTRGMGDAAERLLDVGPGGPEHWEWPFHGGEPRVHVVILCFGDAQLEQLGRLEPFVEGPSPCCHPDGRPGVRPGGEDQWVTRWSGFHAPERREPFGFVDGISDPVIEGSPKPLTPGNGVWDGKAGEWRPVRAGEAILGHHDESGAVAGHPDAAHLERDGSYLVVRKLEQDVQGFHDACRTWSDSLVGTTPEEVEAQLVGRHHDGRVVGAEQLGARANDFLYRNPQQPVAAMPHSSHVRRANPRDGIAAASAIVPRHLLFRRSYRYRDEVEVEVDGSQRTEEKEGLLFLACCADLRRQFEFVQAQWLQDGNRFGLGYERDPIVGTRQPAVGHCPAGADEDQVSIAHGDGRARTRMSSFVTTRGGEYFLLPSRSALQLLGDERSR